MYQYKTPLFQSVIFYSWINYTTFFLNVNIQNIQIVKINLFFFVQFNKKLQKKTLALKRKMCYTI